MIDFRKNTVSKAVLVVGIITLLMYLRTLAFDVVNYDDPPFINNPAIRVLNLDFFRWALTDSAAGWWMPLVWISFAVDYFFWEGDPAGYHLTNTLLHVINATLVVVMADTVYKKIYGRAVSQSHTYPFMLVLAGLLFAIHPANVESVAWVVERKNVLSTAFALGAILSYLKHLESLENEKRDLSAYLLSLFFLALSLMAKPVGVIIPVMLLVADFYPFGRFSKKGWYLPLVDKLPHFAIAFLAAVATIHFASGERILVPLSLFSLHDRLILSGYAVFEYGRILLAPYGIMVMYLIPPELPFSYSLKAAVVLFVTVAAVLMQRKKPSVTAVWLGFLVPLLPSLHFFINGACTIGVHLLYLSSIVPGIAAAAIIVNGYRTLAEGGRRGLSRVIQVVIVVLLLFYIGLTQRLLGTWKHSGTLWTRVIEVQPVGRAYYFRGNYFFEEGNYTAAADDFLTSIKLAYQAGHPEVYTLHAFRGEALLKGERYEESVEEFSKAIDLSPIPTFFYYRSLALRQLGRVREAEEDLARAGGEHGPIIWQYLRNRDDLKPRQGR